MWKEANKFYGAYKFFFNVFSEGCFDRSAGLMTGDPTILMIRSDKNKSQRRFKDHLIIKVKMT